MGRFVVYEKNGGLQFCLEEDTGKFLAVSTVYRSLVGCCKGINSVMKNAPAAHLEDKTAQDCVRQVNPKFEIYQCPNGKYQFCLRARNGEVISVSSEYGSHQLCLDGVQKMRLHAENADPEFV